MSLSKSYFSVYLVLSILLLNTVATATEKQPVLVNIKRMSLTTALKLAKVSIDACRKASVQIAVTVVDRGGHPQVVLRDVLAADLTLKISRQKAYTAMTFNSSTADLEERFKSPLSVGKVDELIMAAGGLPISAGGSIIGGVGVSGAPSGITDEKCAQAGIDAISDDLEMAVSE